MLIFATLGPPGSNHADVAQRYLDFHGLNGARIELFAAFASAFEALLDGSVQYLIQVAVHPSVTDSVARYRGRAHIIDTFISPSQPMAVLTRKDVAATRSLGLQLATREYVDTSAWDTLVPEPSTVAVAEGLVSGKYDSGITLRKYADTYADHLRIDQDIGTVVDPWLVYGTQPVCAGGVVAWPNSPAAKLFADHAI
ncbi:MAG: hypothetical protein HOI95_21375 [Chromatiales bacterium]|jgi:hypothetical protein|nr:hypothetical protein [Chromatiales bacterium]